MAENLVGRSWNAPGISTRVAPPIFKPRSPAGNKHLPNLRRYSPLRDAATTVGCIDVTIRIRRLHLTTLLRPILGRLLHINPPTFFAYRPFPFQGMLFDFRMLTCYKKSVSSFLSDQNRNGTFFENSFPPCSGCAGVQRKRIPLLPRPFCPAGGRGSVFFCHTDSKQPGI